MENLIPLISKLQDVFATVENSSEVIQLPQIVVVGSQSAGKTSLLERIMGKDFLPRGTGIVTRQPLVLDLVNTPKNDHRRAKLGAPDEADFAIFEETPELVYTDFKKVRKAIWNITNRDCGKNKGVINKQIKLRVYSHRVVDLSLVDLPGMTNLPVGDQPANIGELIRAMIKEFIENKESIILAVTPANQDFATSESLKMAKDVDPNGDRTLAVITKLDLMDKGTNALEVLKGNVIPVKRGIVGVRNRGHAQMNQPLEDALDEEVEFLFKHYPTVADKHGVAHLTKMLSELLTSHIQSVLPGLVRQINEKAIEFEQKLAGLGETFPNPGVGIVKIIGEFCTFYQKQTFEGVADFNAKSDCPATAMSKIFHDQFAAEIDKITPLNGVTFDQIRTMIRNSQGLYPHVFIPPHAFMEFLSPKILLLKKAAQRCVDKIHREMFSVVGKFTANGYYERFPLVRSKFNVLIEDYLNRLSAKTKNYVEYMIDSESAYINTRHTSFYHKFKKTVNKVMKMNDDINGNGGTGMFQPAAKKPRLDIPIPVTPSGDYSSSGSDGESGDGESDDDCESGESDDGEIDEGESDDDYDQQIFGKERGTYDLSDRRNIALIHKLIPQYFNVVRNNVKDSVPKLIVCGMIKAMRENLQSLLLAELHKTEVAELLFREDSSIVKQRNFVTKMLKALNTANETVRSVGLYAESMV